LQPLREGRSLRGTAGPGGRTIADRANPTELHNRTVTTPTLTDCDAPQVRESTHTEMMVVRFPSLTVAGVSVANVPRR